MTPRDLGKQLESLWSQIGRRPEQAGRVRVGIDLVDVEVLTRQLESSLGEHFKAAKFSSREIDDCRGLPERFATRWALKEAVSKAIGSGFRCGLRPEMIEVVTAPTGAVDVQAAHGHTWPLGSEQWAWAVSASHESGVAAAIAIALTTQQTGMGVQ